MKVLVRSAVVLLCLASSAPSWAADPSQAQIDAAKELLDVMHMDKLLAYSMDTMLQLQMQQNPGLAPFEGVMREFLGKYMSYSALEDDFARIYADAFTKKELDELVAFYKSPVGQKAVQTMPDLMQKGAELGQRRVQEHMTELQTMIEKRATELQGSGGIAPAGQ